MPTRIAILSLSLLAIPDPADGAMPPREPAHQLAWSDAFNADGRPDPEVWHFEEEFVRTREFQWYKKTGNPPQ